jgi:hypothetical protein
MKAATLLAAGLTYLYMIRKYSYTTFEYKNETTNVNRDTPSVNRWIVSQVMETQRQHSDDLTDNFNVYTESSFFGRIALTVKLLSEIN